MEKHWKICTFTIICGSDLHEVDPFAAGRPYCRSGTTRVYLSCIYTSFNWLFWIDQHILINQLATIEIFIKWNHSWNKWTVAPYMFGYSKQQGLSSLDDNMVADKCSSNDNKRGVIITDQSNETNTSSCMHRMPQKWWDFHDSILQFVTHMHDLIQSELSLSYV